eukprot:TRINITY_DN233_c0_g2_i1.p1 TRINITY_DN233_c0_g2~~TRINITY_DN233_c0_g2_i1.p1  ORF type:complete len:477 (-),score=115.92 TRINITY_DN233_c0_g2_i1:302-1732(-)
MELSSVFLFFFVGFLLKKIASRFLSKPLYWEWDNGADGIQNARIKIDTSNLNFPRGFLWGTATAAHQVEGNCTNNNWHVWEHSIDSKGKSRIHNGEKSGAACEHWQRYPQDIQLMKQLGLNAYRFSLEWSKIEPQPGQFDAEAVAHYHQVIDALLQADIVPMVTLHHFTNPIWFDEMGGWENEKNIDYFVNFSAFAFEQYRHKVKLWCTINEPEVVMFAGYFVGNHPPGKQDAATACRVLSHLLEAHVRTYFRLKEMPGGSDAQIGLVKDIFQFEPWTWWNPCDRILASSIDHLMNGAILDFFRTGHFKMSIPLVFKIERYNSRAPHSNDFFGLNYYSHYHVQMKLSPSTPFQLRHRAGAIMTDMTYPIYPEGFYRALMRMGELKKPVYVTENGLADDRDDRRHLFLRRYLYAMSKAIADGVDCRGYFYWTLMDNFEWSEGYAMRFGLYSVDFQTQERKLRDGAKYFAEVVQRFSQ